MGLYVTIKYPADPVVYLDYLSWFLKAYFVVTLVLLGGLISAEVFLWDCCSASWPKGPAKLNLVRCALQHLHETAR